MIVHNIGYMSIFDTIIVSSLRNILFLLILFILEIILYKKM